MEDYVEFVPGLLSAKKRLDWVITCTLGLIGGVLVAIGGSCLYTGTAPNWDIVTTLPDGSLLRQGMKAHTILTVRARELGTIHG